MPGTTSKPSDPAQHQRGRGVYMLDPLNAANWDIVGVNTATPTMPISAHRRSITAWATAAPVDSGRHVPPRARRCRRLAMCMRRFNPPTAVWTRWNFVAVYQQGRHNRLRLRRRQRQPQHRVHQLGRRRTPSVPPPIPDCGRIFITNMVWSTTNVILQTEGNDFFDPVILVRFRPTCSCPSTHGAPTSRTP